MVTWIIRQPISPQLHVYKPASQTSRSSEHNTPYITLRLLLPTAYIHSLTSYGKFDRSMYVVRLQPHVYYSSSSLICGLFAILLAERPYGRMTTPRLAEFAQVTQPVRCGATLVIPSRAVWLTRGCSHISVIVWTIVFVLHGVCNAVNRWEQELRYNVRCLIL
jgi:hypothetical protein